MTNLNDEQPAPTPGNGPHSVDLVVADLMERKRVGTKKYGVAHQFDNGRDHLIDAYQELMDAAVYLRAELEKRSFAMARVARLDAALRLVLPLAEAWASGANRSHPSHEVVASARAALEGE